MSSSPKQQQQFDDENDQYFDHNYNQKIIDEVDHEMIANDDD